VPTLLVADGFRFYFFSNEVQEPPHVHVEKAGGAAKLWLAPVRFAYAMGFNRRDLRRIRELAFLHQAMFISRWNEHFRH
jgi:hypothetical protein